MKQLAQLVIVLIVLPLAGAAAADLPLARYLEFPPQTLYVAHAPFSFAVFCLYLLAVALCALPFLRAWNRRPPHAPGAARGCWPAWGAAGPALIGAAWIAAWSRIPALDALQPHTFFPLWLGYIISANALCLRRRGTCPLLAAPGRYLLLFPLSAAFWWSFEYLNRFVQNWSYVNTARFAPLEYFVFASLSFSTVLPAVLVTHELFAAHPNMAAFRAFRPLPALTARPVLIALLALTTGLLALVGVFPNTLFPALWVLPPALLALLQALQRRHTIFAPLAAGDWSDLLAWAAAALCCGFFWEMWNYASYCKWVYHIPYVQALWIFEMPLLGYAGYLPFGVFCGAVCACCARFAEDAAEP